MCTRIVSQLLSMFPALALAALLSGCGDDAPSPMTMQNPGQGQQPDPLSRKAIVLSTDYQTGNFAVVDLDAKTAMSNVGPVHSDPAGRIRNKKLYVINRLLADNIQVVDPSQQFKSTTQFSVGNGSNPQDIAFANDSKIYVSLFERAHLGIFDPATGMDKGKIDLAMFADADGTPETTGLTLIGSRLFVAIQGIDRNGSWAPVRDGELAVIDTTRDAVEDLDTAMPGTQGIRLLGRNPNTVRPVGTDTLYVSSTGDYTKIDTAGLERVRLTPPYAAEWLVQEQRLGGNATTFATNDGDTFFLVLSIAQTSGQGFDTAVVRYRASTDEIKPIVRTDGFQLAGIALTSKNELLVCDRTPAKPGIRIFDGESGQEMTTAPIDVGLPPSLVLPFDDPTGVIR